MTTLSPYRAEKICAVESDNDKAAGTSKARTRRITILSSMPRTLHTAEAIQAEVSRQIQAHRDVRASAAVIAVPFPTPQRLDGTGLNWWMSGFGNAFGFQEIIGIAVNNVGKRWNLIE